ncbi:unnamed protein product [Durusdinium trenchii]|uniref:Uncharacterized protein n=1 Tax=Durusdinium trenchii TaxID=1381693 RepID=A0ABP0I4D3_9DINO
MKAFASMVRYFWSVHVLQGATAVLYELVRREHLRFEYTAKVLNEHKGMVKLGKSDVVVTWSELLARAPSYFRTYLKGSEYFKKMSKEAQSTPYGRLVMRELRAVAPAPGTILQSFAGG